MTKPITFTLDGREVTALPGETIWQAAKRLGTDIPHLCWRPEPGYRADGNCRACMVEVKRLHELGRSLNDRLIQAAGANCNRAGLDTRAIEHVAQADASPSGISHGSVFPLSTGDSRPE